MTGQQRIWLFRIGILLGVLIAAVAVWLKVGSDGRDKGLASGNGRIEAVEIDVSAKSAGRIKELLVREGDFVTAGQVVARMDIEALEAQQRQAEAQLQQAQSVVVTAYSQLAQRESEKAAAAAVVAQREAELFKARQHWERSMALVQAGAIARQDADDDMIQQKNAEAALTAARAQMAASQAASMSMRAQIGGAQSSVKAARANLQRIQADISDCTLVSPRAGRVQYRVAQAGEVVGAGGRVVNLVDLADVYMTFFLPMSAAGRVAIGADVRLVLDAAPQFVIPATVSFVADVAQFTPKTVETASEREKLMFRVRARIPEELLKKHITRVKTGLPGVAYVLIDPGRPWPERLQVKLPP